MSAGALKENLSITLAGARVNVLKGGAGEPLLVFHRDTGRGGWSRFHAELATAFTVYAPSLPGFADSEPLAWLRTVQELGILASRMPEALDIGHPRVVGLGFGGWVAAEAIAACPHCFSALALHSPMGIRPPTGEIVDQFLIHARDYVKMGFTDEAAFVALFGEVPAEDVEIAWDIAREMTTRIAWKPYLFNPNLPFLLKGVSIPTLVLTSSGDRVVPRSVGEAYSQIIANAQLKDLDRVGHQADLESPKKLAAEIIAFFKAADPNGRNDR